MNLLRRHLRALTFEIDPAPLSPRVEAALLCLHLLALGAVTRLAHWPIWAPLLGLGLLALPQIWRRTWRSETLAPLFLVYAVTGLRLLLALGYRGLGLTSGGLSLPEPWSAYLRFDWAAIIAGLWAGLGVLKHLSAPAQRLKLLALGLGLVALGSAAGWYFKIVPGGVTGSDPYAYAQMAVDLAEHGDLRHRFALVPLVTDLHLRIYPVLHVGYYQPPEPQGLSPTVWPPGYPVLLAGAYRLLGERGLLLFNPLLGLGALLLTFIFSSDLLGERPDRFLVAALAVFWLATAPEQMARLSIPLADIATQVLTLGALGLAWRTLTRPAGSTGRHLGLSLLAGLCFGWAYFTRYTQVLAAPAFMYLALTSPLPPRRRWQFLMAFGLAASAVALLSFGYLWLAFNNPFNTGSGEWIHFHLSAMPAVIRQVGGEMFGQREWGLVWPFMALGVYQLWRRHRRGFWLGVLAYGPLLAFHLPYAFLKLRDLLWLYPGLSLLAALGLASVLQGLARWQGLNGASRVAAALLAVGLLFSRWQATDTLTRGFFTFGALTADQRQQLGTLATLTPADAVIACSLNSGAVELYTGRATVRPGAVLQPRDAWTIEAWLIFVEALRAEHRPLYVLVDGVELEEPLNALRARYTATAVTEIYLPYYYAGGGSLNQMVPVYKIEW